MQKWSFRVLIAAFLGTTKETKKTDNSCIKFPRQHSVWRTTITHPLLLPPLSKSLNSFFSPSFFKKSSTFQFKINNMEMNKVPNTNHSSSGLVLRITAPIFLYTIRLYLWSLLLTSSQSCMSYLNSEKKIKFMMLKSLDNAFASPE